MIIKSRRIWLEGGFSAACLLTEDGRINGTLPYTATADIDFGDAMVVPGFIDIHTHGAFGTDTNSASAEDLLRWAEQLPREGVTAFLPTVMTDTPQRMGDALAAVCSAAGKGDGAEILGAHLEGPFLAPKHRGAHPESLLLAPSAELFDRLHHASSRLIKVITMAPELPGADELLRHCVDLGVRVSLGHSGAGYETAMAAISAGAAGMTHVFNGMAPLHHREPGILGAALSNPDVFGEIIADGLHCHPAVAAAFYRSKNPGRAIMITDSLAPKGCPPGDGYLLGGEEVTLGADGLARVTATGTIAGSTLAVNRGIKKMVEAGVPFADVLASCTIAPAEYLGIAHRKGSFAPGLDADIAVLDDSFAVIAAFCRGKAAF